MNKIKKPSVFSLFYSSFFPNKKQRLFIILYHKKILFFNIFMPACRRCQNRGGYFRSRVLYLVGKGKQKIPKASSLSKSQKYFTRTCPPPAPACRRCHVRVVSYDNARLFPRDCKIVYWRHFLSVCDSFSLPIIILRLASTLHPKSRGQV